MVKLRGGRGGGEEGRELEKCLDEVLKQVKSWEQWSQICSLNAVLVTTIKISSVLGATAGVLNYAPSLFILSKIGFSFYF